MIHIDVKTGAFVCDRCGATLQGGAGDRALDAFKLNHGQCQERAPARSSA